MSGSMQVRRASAGFTLVEVLTAISLLGVIGAIAATNFRAQIPAFRARGAALLIAGDMSQARMNAVKEGRRWYFTPDGSSYIIQRDDGLGGTVDVKNVDVASEYPHVGFGYSGVGNDPYGNVIGAAMPGASIVFHSNGTVQNAAGVFLETDTGDGDTAHHAVTVTAAGRVRVWHHNGSNWN